MFIEENDQSDLGDLQPFKELDFETAWESYWAQYGEYLVWEGWVNKYPEQVDFNEYRGMPCVAEVELTAEGDMVIVKSPEGHNEGSDNTQAETQVENEYEEDFNASENPTDEANRLTENVEYKNGTTEDQKEQTSGYSGFQMSYNCAIENTMTNLRETEDNINSLNLETAEDNNLANQNAEMVQMMHCYSSASGQHQQSVADDENDEQTYQDEVEWQDLWNEHYTENYWYYYSQFKDEFQRLKAKGDTCINLSAQYQNVVESLGNTYLTFVSGEFEEKENCSSSNEPSDDNREIQGKEPIQLLCLITKHFFVHESLISSLKN